MIDIEEFLKRNICVSFLAFTHFIPTSPIPVPPIHSRTNFKMASDIDKEFVAREVKVPPQK